jgi:uncharacterized protein
MTEKDLQNLLMKYRVPPHIRAHMEKVSLLAGFLAKKMKKRGHKIDTVLLRQACLLHDLVKICEIRRFDGRLLESANADDLEIWRKIASRYSKIGHIQAASEILTAMGERKLSKIILKHRFEAIVDPSSSERPATWEEKLLYYADKKVMHDKIVPLKVRLEDGRERYFKSGKVPAKNAIVEKAIFTLEKELCSAAGVNPADLSEYKIDILSRQLVCGG